MLPTFGIVELSHFCHSGGSLLVSFLCCFDTNEADLYICFLFISFGVVISFLYLWLQQLLLEGLLSLLSLTINYAAFYS